MKSFIRFFLALFVFISLPVYASSPVKINPNLAPEAISYIDNCDPSFTFESNHINYSPRRDEIIGERFQAGDTWYDFHANGSVGKMIAVEADGGVHITWCDGYEEDILDGERHQKYNFLDPENEEWIEEDGALVDFGINRGGFGCMALTAEDEPRALVFYHGKVDTAWTGFCGIDFEARLGVFETISLPRYPQMTAYFPQGVVSPEGRIHIATQRRDRGMIGYIFGQLDDDGMPEFDEIVQEVGETHRTTLRIACSQQSERAAIVWMASRVGYPVPDECRGAGTAEPDKPRRCSSVPVVFAPEFAGIERPHESQGMPRFS